MITLFTRESNIIAIVTLVFPTFKMFIEVMSLCFSAIQTIGYLILVTKVMYLNSTPTLARHYAYVGLFFLLLRIKGKRKNKSQGRDLIIKDLFFGLGSEVQSEPPYAYNETGNTFSLRLSFIPSPSPLFTARLLA